MRVFTGTDVALFPLLLSIDTQVSAEVCGRLSVWLVLCPCSAGVGRTGTFIVIDAMIDMMHAEQKVDVFGFVAKIREQRSQLIQTDVSWRSVKFPLHSHASDATMALELMNELCG